MQECLSGGACRSPAHLTALGPGGFGMLAHKSRALESLQQSAEALTTSSPLEYQPHSVTPPPPLFPPRYGEFLRKLYLSTCPPSLTLALS